MRCEAWFILLYPQYADYTGRICIRVRMASDSAKKAELEELQKDFCVDLSVHISTKVWIGSVNTHYQFQSNEKYFWIIHINLNHTTFRSSLHIWQAKLKNPPTLELFVISTQWLFCQVIVK